MFVCVFACWHVHCELCVLQLELLSHLQQRVDGSILVALLCVQHSADHLFVQVGEHVLQSLQVFLTAHWPLSSNSWHGCWHCHGHHALVVDCRHA